jgi:hypothetical protein
MGLFLELRNHTSLHVDDKGSGFQIPLNETLPSILSSVLKDLQLIKDPSHSLNRTKFSSILETTET